MVLKIQCANKEVIMTKMKYYNKAERLYIEDKMPVDEIAMQLNISRRTLFYWKKKYNWDKRRNDLNSNYLNFSADLRNFIRKLMIKLTKDMDNKTPTTQAEIYSLLNLIKSLPEVKKYENSVTKTEKFQIPTINKTLSTEFIEQVEHDILGFV